MKALLLTAIVLSAAVFCGAATITVNWNGSADYTTIQAAINDANDFDTIIVAEGTYTGDGNRDIDFLGKAITVRSTDPNDPAVVAVTVIDCEGSWSSRHRGFKFHSGEGSDSVVSGLTITKGYFGYTDDAYGGGIYCSGSSPCIDKCIITNNRAKGWGWPNGGTYGENAFGGGIYCTSNSNPLIIECTITNNVASGGNGEDEKHGGDGFGGGIYCNSNSSPTIMNCIISDNTTWGGDGGNGYMYDGGDGGAACGAGIYCNANSNATIRNCIITDNTASGGDGGDGYEYDEMQNSPGEGGNGLGGGVFCSSDSAVNISNCTIGNNMTIKGLGGDEINGEPSYADGYSRGGGVYQSAEIYNSIVWGNTAEYGEQIWGSPTVSYSDVEGGFSGTGNIGVDPNFVAGPLGDYYLSQISAGQDINSPCVDAGSDTAGNLGMDEYTTRTDQVIDLGIVDMGYHYDAPLLYNPANLNNDRYVNLDDVLIMALQWLDVPGEPSADIAPEQLDNFVDYLDFTVIQQNWQWPE